MVPKSELVGSSEKQKSQLYTSLQVYIDLLCGIILHKLEVEKPPNLSCACWRPKKADSLI